MATQVLRFKARPELAGGLVSHIEGHSRPETARGNVADPVVVLERDRDRVRARAQAVLNAKRAARKARRVRGPKPCPAVEFVLAGPPAYGSPGEWDRDRERAWAGDAVEWVRDLLGPQSVIAVASLHRDETSPHVHVLAVPVAPDGELGWTNHLKAIGESRCGIPRAKQKRGRVHSALQDDFHLRVSSRYGLARGEKGSKATHKQIDRMKAAVAEAEKATETTERNLEKAADEARKLAAGDEAMGRAHGITLTPTARRGRKERERLQRTIDERTHERDEARAAAVRRGKEMQAMKEAHSAELGELKETHSRELAKATTGAFADGKAEGRAQAAAALAKAEARANEAVENARKWAEYARRMKDERDGAIAERDGAVENAASARDAADQWRAAEIAARAREAAAEQGKEEAWEEVSRLRAGLGHGHGAAGVTL